MKKLFLGLLGVGIAVALVYVVLKPAAIAPNGELVSPSASVQSSPVASTLQPIPEAFIIITKPEPLAYVTNPIVVSGQAIAFENTINWRLRDQDGKELAKGFTTTNAPDVGQYGDYTFKIPWPKNVSKTLTIEVYESSAKDGSEIHKASVPVRIK